MKAILRTAIVALLVFVGYVVFSAPSSVVYGNVGPRPTCPPAPTSPTGQAR